MSEFPIKVLNEKENVIIDNNGIFYENSDFRMFIKANIKNKIDVVHALDDNDFNDLTSYGCEDIDLVDNVVSCHFLMIKYKKRVYLKYKNVEMTFKEPELGDFVSAPLFQSKIYYNYAKERILNALRTA